MFPSWPVSTFPSGASRPIPPATILSIPAHNPQQANSLPPGLAGRRLTFLPTTFLTSTKHHLPTKYRSPPFFHSSSFFYFLYRRQHPPGLHLFVPPTPISSPTFPMPSTSSVLLPLLQPAGQTRNVVSRAGAACKAADGAGEEPAFLFFLSFFIFFCFSLFSILSHLPGAAASPRRLHFSFYFCSYFCFFFFSFCFYFCFFLFAFFYLFFF